MAGKAKRKEILRPPRQILARTTSSSRNSLRSSINQLITNNEEAQEANFWNVTSRWFADATEEIVGNVSGAAVDDTAFRTSGIEIVSAADFEEDDYNDDDDCDNIASRDRNLFVDLSSIGDTVTPSDMRTTYSRRTMITFICKWVLLAFIFFSVIFYSIIQYTPYNLSMPSWLFVRRRSKRFQLMKDKFIEISGEEAFFDINSPQYRALLFVAEDDPLKLNPNDPSVSTQIIQRYVLSVLYFATNGPSWKQRVYWLTGQHECGWQFVLCSSIQDENNYNATSSDKNKLQKIAIKGDVSNPENIDDDFSDFADSDVGLGKGRVITGLKLYNNGLLGGFLPIELVELKYLRIIDLGGNTLGGIIEPYFSRFTHLSELYLNRNEFRGRLNANMTKGLAKLKVLSIGRNFLSGRIDNLFLGGLASLENLSLEFNRLSGFLPSALGKMKALQHVRLGGNKFRGKIPPYFAKNLPNLQRLWLQENKLTGTIPSSLFCDVSSTLVDLRLQNNSFTGKILTPNCTMKKLELLSMASNGLGGSIPNDFGNRFPSLKELHLYDNQLTSTVPSSIFNPVNLTAVLLGMNMLKGTLSGGMIHEANNLVYLYLNANELSGTLDEFAQIGLHALKKLRLEYNRFSGTVPKLDFFSSLELFYAYNNSLLTSGLDNLSSSMTLKKLKISNCSLAGEIPTTLGSLTGLEILHLNGNHLSGTVPSELQKLTALEELRLDSNSLSGVVPLEVCSLRKSQLSTFVSDCGEEWSGVACSCCTECM